MNSAQNQAIIDLFCLIQREKHRKKLKSARDKRYYAKNKAKILAKNKIKNNLYKKFITQS
jgi:hypothetical protein